MGTTLSKLLTYFLGTQDLRILMVGLDAAGKTTILYKLKVGEVITTIPTIGFNVETVEFKNIRFTVWDVGGQKRIRSLWYHYFANTAAVIFVLDSTDADRIAEAAQEMHSMMDHHELRNSVLLVLANKQDLPNALTITEIVERLEMRKLKHCWHIQGTCATQGNGLCEALEYLREMLTQRK